MRLSLARFRSARIVMTLAFVGFLSADACAQVFLMRENFSASSGNTPPPGWKNEVVQGNKMATWRFDNQGNRPLSQPFSIPYAIFDTRALSLNAANQSAYLESPSIDAPQAGRVVLSFDNLCDIDTGGVCKVQVFNGDQWKDIAKFEKSTLQARNEVFEISSSIKAGSAFRIRFVWEGTQSGFWAIDNIRVFIPSSVDAGVSALTSPTTPFGEGPRDISVSLTNYGASDLTSAIVKWTLDGSPQPAFNWSGSLALGSSSDNIRLGSLNFKAGVNYTIKAWSESPNGVNDVNPSNDSTIRTLIPSLCGKYTIGGSNPDFPTITRAVEFLNNAGVGCAVRFLIRDGTYSEQFEVVDIKGASSKNTVTFESESGDSSRVTLTSIHDISSYPYTIRLNGTKHLRFKNLTISKKGTYWDYWAMEVAGDSYDVEVANCRINPTEATGILVKDRSDSIVVRRNYMTGLNTQLGMAVRSTSTGLVVVEDNVITSFLSHGVFASAGSMVLARNRISGTPKGIFLECSGRVLVSGNELVRVKDGIHCKGKAVFSLIGNRVSFGSGVGVLMEADIGRATIQNNWVYNGFNDGSPPISGISVKTGKDVRLYHNSIHLIRSTSTTSAVNFESGVGFHLENNIFSLRNDGVPLMLKSLPTDYRLDRNGYYSPNKTIGSVNEVPYRAMDAWRLAVKGDAKGVFCNPYFRNDSLLVPNHTLLNDSASVIEGVRYDIDSTLRDTRLPDIGAKEFSLCSIDAGVSIVSHPDNPVVPGVQEIRVVLTNHGVETLSSIAVEWSVNDGPVSIYNWRGSLASGQSVEAVLGTYDFKPVTQYFVKAWTTGPNGKTDCNNRNDTSSTAGLFAKLCGTYTIGGSNPDFKTLTQAVDVLNRVGVGCAVTFKLRDGVYEEQVRIDTIPGATFRNTVTFESESGDSSRVTITSRFNVSISPYTVNLNGTRHLRFRNITISKNGTYWDYWALELSGQCYDIDIRSCRFNPSVATAILVKDKSDSIQIRGNYLTGGTSPIGNGIRLTTTGMVRITDNRIDSFPWNGIYASVIDLEISGNRIERSPRGLELECSGRALVADNQIGRCRDGMRLRGGAAYVVSGNRVSFGSGIGIEASVTKSTIHNNWVYNGFNDGGASTSGILLSNCIDLGLYYNSVHLIRNGFSTSALTVREGRGVSVNNNIFSLKQEGYPVNLEKLPVDFKSDRNGYFSPSRFVGSLGDSAYRDMDSWRRVLNGEGKGVFCNPFFRNDSLLVPSHILLNGAASVLQGIRYDIDSKLRDSLNPDIGAVEFDPCQTDAGVALILSPENPVNPGPKEVKVLLTNQGLEQLSSAAIGWSVNGVQGAVFNWKGSLASGQVTEVVVGSSEFKTGTQYVVKAWTSNPNGKPDCRSSNDTSSTVGLFTKLCGTYTIGGANPDFKTVGQAVDVLNRVGVSCAVVFRLRDGVYDEQLRIDSIPGASQRNTVTFESESGDSSRVTITSKFDMSISPYTLNLNGTRHLRLHGISLSKKGTYWDYWALELSGECYDIEIRNCLLNPVNASAVLIRDESDSIHLRQNNITGGNSVISTAVLLRTAGYVRITDNLITSFPWQALNGYAGKIEFSRNRISGFSKAVEFNCNGRAEFAGNTVERVKDGIQLGGIGVFRVLGNRISFGVGTGLYAAISNSLVSNNWVRNTDSVSTNGILFVNSSKNRVLYNSVNISGKNNNSSSITMETAREMLLLNNVFRNMAGGYCMKIVGDIVALKADHNNYFAPLSNIALHNSAGYTYLKDWGNLIKGESNGVFCNPFFSNDSSYRPNHILLDKAGMSIDSITHDIDSVSRDPVSPDIGVKEFQPCENDAGINQFTTPLVSVFGGMQSVKVVLQNQGLNEIKNVSIHWMVNGLPQVPLPWRGSLAYKKNVEVELGQFNFTKGLEYTLKVWTVSPNEKPDCNTFNDTSIITIPGIQQPADAVRLQTMQVESECGSSVEVPVRSYSFTEVSSLRFSLNWDTTKVRFEKVVFSQADSLGLSDRNFDYTAVNRGVLVFSWNRMSTPQPLLRDTANLFRLVLRGVSSSTTTTQVVFSNSPDSIRVIDSGSKTREYVALEGYLLIRCSTQISGRVYSPSNHGLSKTVVSVESRDSVVQLMTDKDGRYSMKSASRDSKIIPLSKQESNTKNGVTTLDIALMQAHILLKSNLNAPYGVIAADVDGSKNVTTADILFLRRFILDYDTILPGNRGWVFLDSLHRFANPSSPFPYPTGIMVDKHPQNVPMSFVGLKMGDVNTDRNPMLEQAPSGDTLRIYCEWVEESDGFIRARLKTRTIAGLMGLQTALSWNPARLSLEAVDANPMGVWLGEKWKGAGELLLSWNDPRADGLSLSEGMTLLELRFRRIGSSFDASIILSERRFPTEAFNSQYQSVAVMLDKNSISATGKLSGIRVYPNPARRVLNVEWEMPRPGVAKIRLLDASGRVVHTHLADCQPGLQRHTILRSGSLTTDGVWLLQVEMDGTVHNRAVFMGGENP